MSILFFLILCYLLISIFLILKQNYKIRVVRNVLFILCDKRFSIFEEIIKKLPSSKDYELTFLNEIVNIRINIQKEKKLKNFKSIYFLEDKITKVANNILVLFNEFPHFKNIDKEEQIEFERKLLELSEKIKELKKVHNAQIMKYNKLKSNGFLLFTFFILGQSNKKYDIWN